jgi:hypothetical protein
MEYERAVPRRAVIERCRSSQSVHFNNVSLHLAPFGPFNNFTKGTIKPIVHVEYQETAI